VLLVDTEIAKAKEVLAKLFGEVPAADV